MKGLFLGAIAPVLTIIVLIWWVPEEYIFPGVMIGGYISVALAIAIATKQTPEEDDPYEWSISEIAGVSIAPVVTTIILFVVPHDLRFGTFMAGIAATAIGLFLAEGTNRMFRG